MIDIILHHYPQSPVAEKVRVGLGVKNAIWRSVEIPRLPPKPDLTPLTGGYRRTPVMQIGADIFCDSECILRALDRHLPEPVLYRGAPPAWNSDGIFRQIFKLVLIESVDTMPPGFVEDRGQLYLGPKWEMAEVAAQVPDIVRSLEERLTALDSALGKRGPFLGGETPSHEDANAYHLIWFLRGRWSKGPALLSALPHVAVWERRVTDIGHGTWTELDSGAALDIARNASPATPEAVDSTTLQGLKPGRLVAISPEGDGGDPEVRGTLRFADAETAAILRSEPRVGEVCIHFPIRGYTIRAQ